MARREERPSPEQLRREASSIEQEGKGREEGEGRSPGDVAGGEKGAAARTERGVRRRPEDEE